MLLKFGVDISRLEMHCRKALAKVDRIYTAMFTGEAVITSTYEGTHSLGSLHYQNRAFDIRRPSRADSELSHMDDQRFVVALKEELGPDFDVILEEGHIHIEYDPK